jgi:N-acyl-D-amino-acid deacylase
MRRIFSILVGLNLAISVFGAQEWDVVIKDGTIIDGTGKAGLRGDVAIKDGRIAQIGSVEGAALRTIDATGFIVAPGFIDVHTHAEGIFNAPRAENFLRMGVTSLIMGNCGASEMDPAVVFRSMEQTNVSANVGTLIGHNAVRTEVMGAATNAPTADQLARMKALVEKAMKAGAVGFSSGAMYSPGKFSQTSEIVELAKVAAAHGGIYATHLRDEEEGLMASLDEAFRVGREANIPVQISHLTVAGSLIYPQKIPTIQFMERARGYGLLTNVISALDKARRSGVKVSQDLYPYSAISAMPWRLLPPEAMEGGHEKLVQRLKDPALRALLKQKLAEKKRNNFANVVIVTARRFKPLQGLTIPEAAAQRSGSASLDAQIELILDLAATFDTTLIIYDESEENLVPLMLLPETMFISDSGTFGAGDESKHPRGFGSAARVLSRYVRDGKKLSLEEAIRKMTSLPATTFHLKDRGEIRVGAWADLVVFDPRTVRENATYATPHVYATGLKQVFVNGVETVTNNKLTGARAGRPLRLNASAP